jgi:hypothetical protein
MLKLAFLILAFVYVGQLEAKLVKKDEYDPPVNLLHFVKLTNVQTGLKHERAGFEKSAKWASHDPGYYTDSFARNTMFHLAAAAYAPDPSLCLNSRLNNATVSIKNLN